MKRFAKWGLTMPATIAVVVALVIPVLLTIATTFGEPKGAFSTYTAFFNSGFRTNILYRTLRIALITTASYASAE